MNAGAKQRTAKRRLKGIEFPRGNPGDELMNQRKGKGHVKTRAIHRWVRREGSAKGFPVETPEPPAYDPSRNSACNATCARSNARWGTRKVTLRFPVTTDAGEISAEARAL